MRRRQFTPPVGDGVLGWPLEASPQQHRTLAVIGFLGVGEDPLRLSQARDFGSSAFEGWLGSWVRCLARGDT